MNNEDLANFVKSMNAIFNNIVSSLEPYKKDLDTLKSFTNSKVEEIAKILNSSKIEKGGEDSTMKLLTQMAKFDSKSIEVPPKVTRTNDS